MTQNIPYQILDPDVIENPDSFYSALLNRAPIYQVPDTSVYLVSSWHLIHEVLKNQNDYSANLTGILITGTQGEAQLFDLSEFGGAIDAIANADEPFHAVHRRLVVPALSSRKVAAMEAEVRGWAVERIEKLAVNGGGNCIDELANAIPVLAMARLTGLPLEDLDQLLSWAFSGGDILAGTSTLDDLAALSIHTSEMAAYVDRQYSIIDKGHQDDEPPEHVLGELVRGVRQGLISQRDAISIMIVLIGAAGESTSSLVGSAIRLLAQDIKLQQKLRDNPYLIDNFIDEVVRLESPFKGHYRVVLNETRLGGVTIPKNARVYLLWAAANRDPSVFQAPEKLDLEREDSSGNLGFGHGIHFCVGARLAQMESRVILEELLKKIASFSLDAKYPVRHTSSIFVRRLAELHLKF